MIRLLFRSCQPLPRATLGWMFMAAGCLFFLHPLAAQPVFADRQADWLNLLVDDGRRAEDGTISLTMPQWEHVVSRQDLPWDFTCSSGHAAEKVDCVPIAFDQLSGTIVFRGKQRDLPIKFDPVNGNFIQREGRMAVVEGWESLPDGVYVKVKGAQKDPDAPLAEVYQLDQSGNALDHRTFTRADLLEAIGFDSRLLVDLKGIKHHYTGGGGPVAFDLQIDPSNPVTETGHHLVVVRLPDLEVTGRLDYNPLRRRQTTKLYEDRLYYDVDVGSQRKLKYVDLGTGEDVNVPMPPDRLDWRNPVITSPNNIHFMLDHGCDEVLEYFDPHGMILSTYENILMEDLAVTHWDKEGNLAGRFDKISAYRMRTRDLKTMALLGDWVALGAFAPAYPHGQQNERFVIGWEDLGWNHRVATVRDRLTGKLLATMPAEEDSDRFSHAYLFPFPEGVAQIQAFKGQIYFGRKPLPKRPAPGAFLPGTWWLAGVEEDGEDRLEDDGWRLSFRSPDTLLATHANQDTVPGTWALEGSHLTLQFEGPPSGLSFSEVRGTILLQGSRFLYLDTDAGRMRLLRPLPALPAEADPAKMEAMVGIWQCFDGLQFEGGDETHPINLVLGAGGRAGIMETHGPPYRLRSDMMQARWSVDGQGVFRLYGPGYRWEGRVDISGVGGAFRFDGQAIGGPLDGKAFYAHFSEKGEPPPPYYW